MSFTVYTFLFIFTTTVLFYGLRKEARPYILLAASLLYVSQIDRRAIIALIVSMVFVYGAGLFMRFLLKKRKQYLKPVFIFSISVFVFILWAMKFQDQIFPLMEPHLSFMAKELLWQALVLPVGFSYYAFQSVSYLADIYRGKCEAETNFFHFALYLCFFPKFLSGPIERAETFLPQVKTLRDVRLFENDRLPQAFSYLLYGFFMKTVVADRLAPVKEALFADYMQHGSLWLFIGSLLYTMQLYCDFAGYSAIAIGVGKLLGFELTENFLSPYLSGSISEFWRRWHCSLSSFLRDYVYIPLGGNRKGAVRRCVNTMIVFLVCGMWHGGGLSFFFWGFLHGCFSIMDYLYRSRKGAAEKPGFIGHVLTFFAVSFAWIPFGFPKLSDALAYIFRIFTAGSAGTDFLTEWSMLGVTSFDTFLIPVFLLLVILMDALSYRTGLSFPAAVEKKHAGLRYLFYYICILLIFIFGIYGPAFDPGQFMYMEF
ncbi:MAG: hypothetical protein K6G83_05270 [Lachnospiraceae bacterium]|nr:hypothetical protein [Lachnospiraceae bacterium]